MPPCGKPLFVGAQISSARKTSYNICHPKEKERRVGMSNMMYGYARVSTRGQKEDRQVAALQEFGVSLERITVEKQVGNPNPRLHATGSIAYSGGQSF